MKFGFRSSIEPYSQVALLVYDDGSPHEERLAELCVEYGAEFERNTRRCPPCKGDLTAFAGGLLWARELWLDVLVKLSRHFVPVTGLGLVVDGHGSLRAERALSMARCGGSGGLPRARETLEAAV